MENMQTVAAQAVPQAAPTAAVMPSKPKAKEHWLVEVAGGATLGMTIMAGLALWTLTVAQMFYS